MGEGGKLTEPEEAAMIAAAAQDDRSYAAGARRSHDEHAAEAYDFANLAQVASEAGRYQAARDASASAQWHATMAVYEALVLPGYGMSVGDHLDQRRQQGAA